MLVALSPDILVPRKRKRKTPKTKPKKSSLILTAWSWAKRKCLLIGLVSSIAIGLVTFSSNLSTTAVNLKSVIASTPAPAQRPVQSRQELEAELREMAQRIADFDDGDEEAAVSLAHILKDHLYTFGDSKSTLEQIGLRYRIGFIDSASPIQRGNWLPYTGLIFMAAEKRRFRAFRGYYRPRIKDLDLTISVAKLPFPIWWELPVIDDKHGNVFSRKHLVLSVAYYDGKDSFASFSPTDFFYLKTANGAGWSTCGYNAICSPTMTVNGPTGTPKIPPYNEQSLEGCVDLVSIRAVAEEYLKSTLDYLSATKDL